MAARPQRDDDLSTFTGRVSARVKGLMKSKSISREVLQERLQQHGVKLSLSAVYHYANGTRPIHPNHYPAFAKALGCKNVREMLPAD